MKRLIGWLCLEHVYSLDELKRHFIYAHLVADFIYMEVLVCPMISPGLRACNTNLPLCFS